MENEILTGNVTVSDKNPFLKTCLYYGWPSAIGGSVSDSVNIYKTYDIVVFGDEYEHPAHEDYANTQLVFSQLLNQAPNIKIFGYILIGDAGPGLPDLSTIQSCIQEWKTLGATGIFLDCYGYDYEVTRERQNTIVSYCHTNNLNVIANAWTVADVFSSDVDATYNPNGIAPVINSDDFMLLENLFWTTKITGSTPSMNTCIEPYRLYEIRDYQSVIKSGETMPWKQRYGTKMIVLDAIPSNASLNDYHKFATVSLIGSAILNLDGVAIGDENWGASESGFYQDWTWPYNLDLAPLSNTAFTYTEKTVGSDTFISTFSNTINSTLYTVTLNYADAEDISYSAGKVKAFQTGSYIEDAWNMASDDLQVDVKYKNEVVARLNSVSSVILNTDNKFVEQNITVEVSKFNRGIDPSDATATASDILSGKTAYIADGSKATGTYVPFTSIYKIYDSNQVEIPISNWTIAGLENAYYYTKNGGSLQRVGGRIFHINSNIAEGSGDKFYVYDNTNGLQSSLMWSNDTSTKMWCTTDTIGSGKTNSAIMLNAKGDTSDTIWYYCKHTMNVNSVGGCNDWYIGSTVENDQLRTSGLVNWFNSKFIWSSVEYLYTPSYNALIWYYYYGYWYHRSKSNRYCCFCVRSF